MTTKLSKSTLKGQETRRRNEHARNLKIERAIDITVSDELIPVFQYLTEVNRYLPAEDLRLSTWAGCYIRQVECKQVERTGGGEGDWDFGYKVYPRNLLV